MTSLIHLNGPPGIGKSTISALYADRHPGVLNLDIDRLHPLVGGWQHHDHRTHDVLRPVALAMASTHLAGGRDVILPQYLADAAEIAAFESAARDRGAAFHEVVLLDDKAASIARFDDREDDSVWGRHNRELVAALGGADMLARLHDRLVEIVTLRPGSVIVHSTPGAIEETYAQVLEALDP